MPLLRLVSQKHLQAIGAVVVHWSLLEQVVEQCLLNAAHIDQNPSARALTVHMNIEQRLDALLSAVDTLMIDERFKEELAHIDRAIRQGRDGKPSPKTERNETVHGNWVPVSKRGGALLWSFKARGKFKLSVARKTPKEIEAIAERIYELTERLESWQVRFLAHLAGMRIAIEEASRETSP